MARTATPQEEAILESEGIMEQRPNGGVPNIRVKVVYKGGNPSKTVRMEGSISREGERAEAIRTVSPHGFTLYDFMSVDNRMRRLPEDLFVDGHRFSWVENPNHVLRLLSIKDEEGQAQFKVVGARDQIDAIKRYSDFLHEQRLRGSRNPEDRLVILRDMGLTESDLSTAATG